MTVEESINLLSTIEVNKNGEFHDIGTWYKGINKDYKEALNMSIKALEEIEKMEKCEDCISREKLMQYLYKCKAESNGLSQAVVLAVESFVEQMPYVTLARKKGKWQYDKNPNIGEWYCSNCGKICSEMRYSDEDFDFCPNCGADMKESED